ncbi:MAG: sugar transferase [Clostridia bacterium]|nr:sugar transferase [Clostridia bacterium]
MYAKYIKRPLDFFLSLTAILLLSPVLLILIVLGAVMMKGNPFFVQHRPGKDERIFRIIKFRTMTNCRDGEGNLLPDHLRLIGYGKFLRSTSLDELPELFNILIGDMAFIGPRPQLVRDMVFMSDTQRLRHSVRPGLSGLAQINGRNAIRWENKFSFDLDYIENITFMGDMKIVFQTVIKVFKRADITEEGMETAEDLGDYLLRIGQVDQETYTLKQTVAKELVGMR